MDLLTILSYLAATLIGITLGVLGGGGSILTVPVFVYLLGISPVFATAYSLFVVGTTSLIGAIAYIKRSLVDFKTAILFAIPSFIAVFLTRKFLIPAIPKILFTTSLFTLTKSSFMMLLFAVIMFAASYSMIKEKKTYSTDAKPSKYKYIYILLEGFIVGVLTGIVGAGGGFLIVPALVILTKLPMKLAVGTSLLIISVKSLIGFLGDVSNLEIDWNFLIIFTSLSVVGILIGNVLSKKIDGKKLKKAFGWFVLLMAFFIFFMELNK